MQVLIYLIFSSIILLPNAIQQGFVPRQIALLPELLSVALVVVVVMRFVVQKHFYLESGYWVILILLGLEITFGVLSNAVAPGIIVNGLRDYVKFLPMFLLPAVYPISEGQFRKQLLFLLGLTLIQLPVALYQRLIQYAGVPTGDVITGTLKGSGILSVYLLTGAAFLTGLYYKNRLSRPLYLGVLAAVFLPTTINETKVTLFLLPVALIVPAVFSAGGIEKIKRLLGVLLLGFVLWSVFIQIYDHFMLQQRTEGVQEFLAKEGRIEGYLEKTGRLQSPFLMWSEDVTKFFLGIGIGNASDSSLGPQFTGKYFRDYDELMRSTLNQWQLELGLLGLLLTLLLFLFVLRDALYLKQRNDFVGAFAVGWIGALAVLACSLVYDRSVLSNEVGYLLWYFSGYIAATACRQRLQT